jgi:cell division protein FtsL
MLVNINQVAKQFGVSKRTIQLWCKSEGIKKIGNEYQLTKEIVEGWEVKRTKSESEPEKKNVTRVKFGEISRSTSLVSSFVLQIVLAVWVVFSIVVLVYLYNDLKNEIEQRDTSIVEYKKEVQNVKNELRETTIQKDNEIQFLKKKIVIDSMLMQTPYFNRRLRN